MSKVTQLEKRLQNLEAHLKSENPILLETVKSFRKLDKVSKDLGFLDSGESYATHIPWWPLIAVLGLYSSGKSTFINHYLNYDLQRTGNQAVDDKFTVACYSNDNTVRVLPGLALDADPRFSFYQISHAIEEISSGEGSRIDAYLQLKTCPSERVRGKILIDSPGFDADDQRTSTLRITNHIIDLSDLVLVFFDARHPEPGTMHDTLKHLVSDTINRPDSNKFLYILNQIDNTAHEDNPEEVVASWQRALAQKGLTAGRFYRIYNPDVAMPIENPTLRERFESKRDADMAEIHARIHQVEIERSYRVVALLDQISHKIEDKIVPKLQSLIVRWRKRVLWMDGIFFGAIIVAVLAGTLWTGDWSVPGFSHPFWNKLFKSSFLSWAALGAVIALAGYAHFNIRKRAANCIIAGLKKEKGDMKDMEFLGNLTRSFWKNTLFWRTIFCQRPAGWNERSRRLIKEVFAETNGYVQELNNRFADPSGANNDANKDVANVNAADEREANVQETNPQKDYAQES